MLNISNNPVHKSVHLRGYKSARKVFHKRHYKHFNRFLLGSAVFFLLVLFLPWTQNVRAKGYLTTLKPDQRPQSIQSPIPGRIEKWYVQEGDRVQKGDTILFISEVKDDFFDPKLLQRTGQQITAKSMSVESYDGKVAALKKQINALVNERKLKIEQSRNQLMQSQLKVQSDSIELEAAKINISIAERQYNRIVQLQEEGLKALTDVEERRLKLQEARARLISRENQLLAARNQVLNSRMEINRLQAEYDDKIAKAESEKYTAQSARYDSEAQMVELQNEYSNYQVRTDMYYIRAPQGGVINRALQGGIGETFKEGDRLLSIMPDSYQMAVEAYVEPIDLPLVQLGEKARIQFDGWPAIVFSGWPNASYGTFGGTIVAVETFISDNGRYRILLAPDPDDQQWPEAIRVGSGANIIALLDDVPIWFELWRQLNGFPPNYYQSTENTSKTES